MIVISTTNNQRSRHPPSHAIYALHAALAHKDDHMCRLFIDCLTCISSTILLVASTFSLQSKLSDILFCHWLRLRSHIVMDIVQAIMAKTGQFDKIAKNDLYAGLPRGDKTLRISDFTSRKYVAKLELWCQTPKNISLMH